MTIPAKYTLTEAHFIIVELEKKLAELEKKHEKLILEIEDQNEEKPERMI